MTTKNNLGPHLTWLRRERPQIPPPRAIPGDALLPPVAVPVVPPLAPDPTPIPPPQPPPPSRRPLVTSAPNRSFPPPPIPTSGEKVRETEGDGEMPVLQLESSVSTRRPKLTSRKVGGTPLQQATPRSTHQTSGNDFNETSALRTEPRRENLASNAYPTPATSFSNIHYYLI